MHLDDVTIALRRQLPAWCARQPMAEGDPLRGAYISPEHGGDEPGHVGLGVLFAALVVDRVMPGTATADADARLRAAGERWLAIQRATGRIDLRNCNYDSGPDTAFLVQQALRACDLADARGDAALRAAIAPALAALRRMGEGLADGGFHTPNHRWVSASGLAQSIARWPELRERLAPTLEALVIEGPDIDDEGFFIERSVAIYDTVCARALLTVDALRPWAAGRAAALANLAADRWLFHADGTCETGLSHRQDAGSRDVAVNLIPVYLQSARATGDAAWTATAAWLWRQALARGQQLELSALGWTAMELLAGAPAAAPAAPADGDQWWPRNRCRRIRAGSASVSCFGETTRLLGVRHGEAELAAVQVGQSYLGHGRFVPATMERDGSRTRWISHGHLAPYRLGYSLPLGEPVAKDAWGAAWERRGLRALPRCVVRLEAEHRSDGVDLHLASESGLDDVLAQISFDFLPGGILETPDLALKPAPGQVVVLRQGGARMSYGRDWIEVAGGADHHRPWAMRDYPAPGGLVRVTVPLLTPIRHTLRIRWGGA